MPAPTITSITPNAGVSGGGSLVTIIGTDFDVPAMLGDPLPTVTVTFDGISAIDIEVRSTTKIVCRVPASALGRTEASRAVDVVVENVDAGPNQGSVTEVDGYTYSRPNLAARTHLAYTVAALVDKLSEQVLANTVHRTHLDYDDEPTDPRTAAAKLPVVILRGPILEDYRVIPEHGGTLRTLPEGDPEPTDFELYERPIPVNLLFEVDLQAVHEDQFYGLIRELTLFPERLPLLPVARDPNDAGAGTIDYPIDRITGFATLGVRTRSNVLRAVATWRVEGVFIHSGDLRDAAPTVDTTGLTTSQIVDE